MGDFRQGCEKLFTRKGRVDAFVNFLLDHSQLDVPARAKRVLNEGGMMEVS